MVLVTRKGCRSTGEIPAAITSAPTAPIHDSEAPARRQTVCQLSPWSDVRCSSAADPVPVGTRDWLETKNPAPPGLNTRPRSSAAGPQSGAWGGAGSQLLAWEVMTNVDGAGGLVAQAPILCA